MLRLNVVPALLAVLLNVFSGSVCCCSAGRVSQLLYGSRQATCCCKLSATREPQLNGACTCNCARTERIALPAPTTQFGLDAPWLAEAASPPVEFFDQFSVISVIQAVGIHPPIPPPCAIYLMNATLLV